MNPLHRCISSDLSARRYPETISKMIIIIEGGRQGLTRVSTPAGTRYVEP